MKIPGSPATTRLFWMISALAILTTGAAIPYSAVRGSKVYAAQEKESARASAGDQSTSLNDQTELNVTVYNSNIALIRDVRNLMLPSGTFRLKFMDIAATVNPATVHFRSLNDPEKLGVIEQNYEYDLLEPAKLLHKYVGKEVTLIRGYQENGTTKREEIRATLLSDNNGRASHTANVAGKLWREKTADRSFLSREQLVMECRLRSYGRARRQERRSGWLGYRRQQQRYRVSQCAAPARCRRTKPRG